MLYGGRVNGSIVRIDPETYSLEELGSPAAPMDRTFWEDEIRRLGGKECTGIKGNERLTGMVELESGLIAGAAGFPKMHVFTLDSKNGNMTDMGVVNNDHEICYFHSVCPAHMPDGRVGLACIETDSSRPDLYICFPKDGTF
jgi:hypothetical protein